ncbi:MAG: transposase [Oscillatoriales cyanobacterium]|nr:MAG: transposase [Oscillatoriales cyanobacterium]TAH24579.1 MAG: transposase [Oscillatoriales cyanobacterium]
MKSRSQYRIYPTDQQQRSLARLFGCVRVAWNDALGLCKQSEKLPKNSDLQKLCITQAKQIKERAWLSKVSNIPLQQSIADLGVAYKNFFDSLKGKRKGQKVGSPKFKKKDNRQSARFTRGGFSIKGNKVYLAKIGKLKTFWSRPLPSEPSSVTVIKDRANRYFLSFVVEVLPEIRPAIYPSVGIDLGIKTFAVLSTGEKIESPDYSPLDQKTRRFQRRLAKRVNGSKRREVMRLKIAKLKAKEQDTRKDFLHKLSTRVVNDNQVIALENLNISGMLKNRCLSRAISQAGWREFRTLIEAKSAKLGREFVVISRWEPTSQICSECGYKWGKLDLSVRELVCLNCGTHHDRDGNAAKNIENFGTSARLSDHIAQCEKVGVGHIHDSKWTRRECKTLIEAVPVEPSTQVEVVQLTLFAC